MNTKIVIKLSTGKEIELTQEEYHELLGDMQKHIPLQPLTIPPLQYRPYPYGYPEITCSAH